MHRGELFILSAPSGAGKTTLINSVLEGAVGRFGGLAFSVSHTTRKPRRGEVPGEDYHFVSHQVFQGMMANEEFLEWAEVHNNYYGTSNAEVFPRLEAGTDVLMDIDVQGAERVLARHPEANSVFIMPPSFEALKQRLSSRGLDDPQEIARRLAVSIWEIKRYHQYDHVIINDDAERASEALASIILERRCRRERMEDAVQEVLRDFRRAAHPGELTPVPERTHGQATDQE
ncbi:MAG: guanylate kinase [Acidobacteriota bacterium]|jgi:guanylate kinase